MAQVSGAWDLGLGTWDLEHDDVSLFGSQQVVSDITLAKILPKVIKTFSLDRLGSSPFYLFNYQVSLSCLKTVKSLQLTLIQ